MNRRTFLNETAGSVLVADEPKKRKEKISPYANKNLPSTARSNAGLEPYTGAWSFDQAAHLLRRTLFGAKKTDISTILQGSLADAVEMLLADQPAPDPPVTTNAGDAGAPVGTTWINASFNQDYEKYRNPSLRAWWIGLMLNQGISLREKMALFWHNHFVTETFVVNDARYSYKYNTLLRQYVFGNFKQLAKDITIDPSMLRYLNGNENIAGAPNENYARELFELFTVGKGPLKGPGDYTNYTEQDVIEAAKVLTGWRDVRNNIASQYYSNRHDKSDKTFSAAFGNKVISNQEQNEYAALIDLIFEQSETAKYICRKLYRWFVYYVIDEAAEQNVIGPLAQELIDNNYEIKPVLRKLFNSAHFFDNINTGCVIKNPADGSIGLCRQFNVVFPDDTQFINQYAIWFYLAQVGALQEMFVGDPPNVAGWPAYYQSPQYHEIWINSVTIPFRNQISDAMVYVGLKRDGVQIIIDSIGFTKATVSDPYDPNKLVQEFVDLLFAVKLTDKQKEYLKDALLPGNLPDYEWSQEWGDYESDPTNTQKQNAVKSKLQALLKAMMSMAEYQLA